MLSMINAVRENAGEPPVAEIVEQSTQRTFAEVEGRRGARMDVLARTADNHVVNIEVQRRTQKGINDRSLFYAAKLLGESAERSLSMDSMLDELPRVMMVNLLEFSLRPGHESFHQPVHLFYDKKPWERASELLAIHNIDLVTFQKNRFDVNNPLHRWLRMLLEGYKNPDYAKEVCKMDAGLQQFAERYHMVASEKHTRDEYFRYRMALREQRRERKEALEEGKQEGLEQGLQQGLQQGRRLERIAAAKKLYQKTQQKPLVAEVFPGLEEADWAEILKETDTEN